MGAGVSVTIGVDVATGVGVSVGAGVAVGIGVGVTVGDGAGVGVKAGVSRVQLVRSTKTTKTKDIRMRNLEILLIMCSIQAFICK